MNLKRRDFVDAALTAGFAAVPSSASPAPAAKEEIPTHKAKVVKVF